jgi:citrate lyase beta subunit
MARRTAGAAPRSAVYWPLDRPVSAETIQASGVQAVILDLEDGVPPERKEQARACCAQAYAELTGLAVAVVVRVNGADTDDFAHDLALLADLPDTAAVLLPKPVTPDALVQLGSRPLWGMAEELGMDQRLGDLRTAAPSLSTLVIGIKDLALELGVPLDQDGLEIRNAAKTLRAAAAAAGLAVLDGIVFGDPQAVERRCRRAAEDGFDGVTLARPSDGATANKAFD